MGDRKSVLIVEDDPTELAIYKMDIEDAGYDVTGLRYMGPTSQIPTEQFDFAVIDGLGGDWRTVHPAINAEKKILFSADAIKFRAEANDSGLVVMSKLDEDFVEDLLGELK